MGFHHVGQAALELLTSGGPPQPPKVLGLQAGTTAPGQKALLTWWQQEKMRRKQKQKPLINPSDLVRLTQYHKTSTGKTSPVNYLPPIHRSLSGRYSSSWHLGEDTAKPYYTFPLGNDVLTQRRTVWVLDVASYQEISLESSKPW